MAIRVLVQAGHIAPREPGFEGGTGAIREQELTKAVRRRLVALLKADSRFKPIPCPGDIPDGVDVDAALFLHGDGAENKTATGYSFGFPIHPVNEKLATMIDTEFRTIAGHPPHHEDNYTGGLREYYGYRRVPTAGPEVLVEHGFLTNPGERKWMFKNLNRLANAEYRALCLFFDLAPNGAIAKRGVVGFTVIGEMDGDRRVLRRVLELSRAVDKLKDRGARLIMIRKDRIPIQPTGNNSSPDA
jgi:N-acetylmuramoyl-L-alanine amidase